MASTISEAITSASNFVAVAASIAGLPNVPVVHVEASTVDELDRELAVPLYTDTVTISEIARILGVSRQRAAMVVNLPAFPVAFATGERKVWRRSDVLAFDRTWERKTGRPAVQR